MHAYSEYKDSKVSLFGQIPEHWQVISGKWACQFTYGFPADSKLFSIEQKGLPLIRIRDIYSTDTEVYYEGTDYPESSLIHKGDVLVGMDGDFNVAKWNGPEAILNQRVCKFESSSVLTKDYVFYLLPLILNDINATKYATTVKHLSAQDLGNMLLPIPTMEEQEKIAVYLDYETSKIDALMSEKQAQIEELRGYRTSLITETVTRGLNSDAPLGSSGIDWLGDIPEHWECIPLKYLVSEPLMYGANETAEENTDVNHPRYIRITDINETGKLKNETFRSLDPIKAQPYILKEGDILFARSGATVGKTYLFNEDYPACFAGYLIKASCGAGLLPKFLILYTNSQSYLNWKNSIFDQSTIQNISADKYNQLPVPLPPLEEQQEIADYLDEKTAKIDSLISELTQQLDELAKYRQAVITEAVTGKVDVRDWRPKH